MGVDATSYLVCLSLRNPSPSNQAEQTENLGKVTERNWSKVVAKGVQMGTSQPSVYGDRLLNRNQGLFSSPQIPQPDRLVIQRNSQTWQENVRLGSCQLPAADGW